jgi:hypothetical protein
MKLRALLVTTQLLRSDDERFARRQGSVANVLRLRSRSEKGRCRCEETARLVCAVDRGRDPCCWCGAVRAEHVDERWMEDGGQPDWRVAHHRSWGESGRSIDDATRG